MKQGSLHALSGIAMALLLAPTSVPAAAKEGFGASKSTVAMERLVPPPFYLGAASFAVRTDGGEARSAWSRLLEVELEREIAARNPELIREQSQPQILIELAVRNQLTDRWEEKMERERKQIGIARNGNSLFQSVEVQARYRVMKHEASASFTIKQVATGGMLGSGSVEAPFEGRFRDGNQAPDAAALEEAALRQLVDAIAGRVAPRREKILVPLPKGRLEALAALAAAGQWQRYREALAALPPSPEPREEAYRQYALATAGEALGYAAASDRRRELLEQAEKEYQAAIAAHPGEKLFTKGTEAKSGTAAAPAPLERVRAALAGLRRTGSAP